MTTLSATPEDHEKLGEILASHDLTRCPNCNHALDFHDIAFSNSPTGIKARDCAVSIRCSKCNQELKNINSWYPEIEDVKDLLYVLDSDWYYD